MLDLRNALASGKIDCIASHHIPQHSDAKNCEFEYAKNGMLGLETCFGVVGAAMEFQWSLSQFILCLTDQPRKIFNLPIPKIEIGAVACLTLFQPNLRYIFESHQVQSASANTPYIGKSLLGKVAGIIHNQHVVLS
jgi:dihydroorotase